MKKIPYLPYLSLILLFFLLLSLPTRVTEEIRAASVSTLSPLWRGVEWIKQNTFGLISSSSFQRKERQESRDKELLLQELLLLKSQMERVREWLVQESRIEQEMQRYEKIRGIKGEGEFFHRRAEEIRRILELEMVAIPAKISFRHPSFWSSSIWINVGEKHNNRLGKQVVGKNSPVILGSSLVGIIEYVGTSQSRVRLITDPSFGISVRVVRGGEQNRHLFEQIDSLLFCLDAREDLFESPEEKKGLMAFFSRMKKKGEAQVGEWYLAKGELKGHGAPLWRSYQVKMKGIGFNYDFADKEGSARELRSGKPYGKTEVTSPYRLIKEGDLLVTTGLDSLLPAGLKVATVSFVETLREGATSYEIEAIPTASQLDGASDLFVLPPL